MMGRVQRLLAVFLLILCASAASATNVTINTDSAMAVLDALHNPALMHEASLKIAAVPGNQGIIRKSKEFKIPANNQNFADALYAAAHGIVVTDATERSYFFDMVKPKVAQLSALIEEINANPTSFQQPIEQRIAMFTPAGAELHLQGYVVAGGDGGGYAFGSTDFFLNLGMIDEFVLAKNVTTHELYHAVQGAFAKDRGAVEELPSLTGMSHAKQLCMKTAQLFADIYDEGSAVEAEDVTLIQQSHSEIGKRKQADMADGMKSVRTSASLLEMSVLAFDGAKPMPFDDVYAVGFYGHGTLYNIGYVMAKAMAEQEGPQGLAAYLKLPSSQFVLGYTKLRAYGKDKDHPALGPNTIAAAERLVAGCR